MRVRHETDMWFCTIFYFARNFLQYDTSEDVYRRVNCNDMSDTGI